MREKDVEDYLVKRVEVIGGEVRKVRWLSRRGAPDRLVMLPGRCVWIELKAPSKKPQPHQLREHERMRAQGQTVLVIDSLASVESFVETLIE